MPRMNLLRRSIADSVNAIGRAFRDLHRREPTTASVGPWLGQFPPAQRREPHSTIGSLGRYCTAQTLD